jgi:hypothetical protein
LALPAKTPALISNVTQVFVRDFYALRTMERQALGRLAVLAVAILAKPVMKKPVLIMINATSLIQLAAEII